MAISVFNQKNIPCILPIYDVFAVYDENDDFARDEILSLFESSDILYCCTERNGNPGNTILDDFRTLTQQSRKILFVVSKYFTENKELVFMTRMAMFVIKQDYQKVVTLKTDGDIADGNGLSCLYPTPTVLSTNKEWKRELIRAIRMKPIEFCSLLNTGKVTDSLLLKGLSSLHLRWEAYGLIVVSSERYLKVDLLEFSKHQQIHNELSTCETCEQCGHLTGIDTTINLAFNDDFSTGQLETIGKDITHLCVALLDTLKTEWFLVCSLSGVYEKKQQKYISDLYAKIRCEVELNTSAKVSNEGPRFPEYVDEEKRLQSFAGVWPKENVPSPDVMAKSGFVFMMKPNVVQCFSCGYFQCLWKADDDPFYVHATATPTCHFVKENIPPESISNRLKKGSGNEDFSNLELRLSSLRESKFLRLHNDDKMSCSEKEHFLLELAEAGFFCGGYGMVRCFSCGILVNYKPCLEARSQIWNLHGTLSPNCEYLFQQKGTEFLQTISYSQKIDKEPTIITISLLTLRNKALSDLPGCIFVPGEHYEFAA